MDSKTISDHLERTGKNAFDPVTYMDLLELSGAPGPAAGGASAPQAGGTGAGVGGGARQATAGGPPVGAAAAAAPPAPAAPAPAAIDYDQLAAAMARRGGAAGGV